MDLNQFPIPLIVIVPLFTALALLLPVAIFNDRRTLWVWTLGSTLVTFVISLAALAMFDWSAAGWQMGGAVPWVPGFGIRFAYGVDAISLWLVLLSTFIMPLVVLAADPPRIGDGPDGGARQFYFWLLMVESAMIAAFVATDAMFFFLCFEFTLVPLYFLIGVFGGRGRLPAARLFFVYTFVGSMFTFAALLYVGWVASRVHGGVWSFDFGLLYDAALRMSPREQAWVLIGLFVGFAVKTPIFPLHTWLPASYWEAPTAGTVVLASVLAKLGAYGLLRLALPMCPDAAAALAPGIAILAVIGIVYAGLICWVQKDLKRLIAYSSISHLGFCVLGLFALDAGTLGGVGSVLYMVNHGLATGALFLCGGMLFERFRTYEMVAMSGLGRAMPVWASFMVFFVMAGVGLPGLNSFVSEFLTLAGAFTSADALGPAYGVAAGLGIILSAIYLLYMVGKVVFGPVKTPGRLAAADLTPREVWALAPLAVACLALGFYPLPVLRSLHEPVEALVAPARLAAMRASAPAARSADARPRQAGPRAATPTDDLDLTLAWEAPQR